MRLHPFVVLTGFLLGAAGASVAVAQTAPPPSAPAPQSPPPAVASTADPEAILREAVQEMQRLSQSGQRTEAVRVAERAHERLAAQLTGDHPLLAVALFNIGAAQRRAGALGEAVVTLQRALAIETRLGSPQRPSFRQALRELAEAERGRGQPDAAVALYDAAVERLRKDGAGTLPEAELLEEQGVLLRHAGQFQRAEEQFKAALAVKQARLTPGDFELATTLTHLGGIARVNGRHEDSETYYRRAIDIVAANKGDKDANLAILIDNLGVLYNQTGRFVEAEAQHKRALAIFEEALGRDHLSTGQCAANLGAALMQQRRYDEAEKLIERGLEVFSRTLPPTDGRIGMALDNLAGVYRNQRRFDRAAAAYERALAILRKTYPAGHAEIGTALNNLALMSASSGRLDQARAYSDEALAITEKALGASHLGVAQVLNNVGFVAARQSRRSDARAAFERAVGIVEQSLGADHPMLVHPLSELGFVLLGLDEPQVALAVFQRAVAIEVARRARQTDSDEDLAGRRDPFNGLIEALWQVETASGKPGARAEESLAAAQWAMQTAAARTIAQLGARLGARTPAIAELTRERQDLAIEAGRRDRQLTELVSRPASARREGDDVPLREGLAAVTARLSALDARLAKEHPGFAELALPSPVSGGELRSLLSGNEALLAMLPSPQHVYVWLARRGEVRWLRLALSEADLERKVRTLRCGLDPGDWASPDKVEQCQVLTGRQPEASMLPFDTAIATELYRTLVAPFATAMEGRHVLVAAGGALSSLPLQVLLTEAPQDGKLVGAKWLGQRLAMTTLPSVATLKTLRREARASTASKPYLGIGNPLLIGPSGDYSAAWGAQSCLAAQLRKRAPAIEMAQQVKRTVPLVRSGVGDVEEVRRLAPLPETRDELCAVAGSAGAGEQDLYLGSRASEPVIREMSASGVLRSYRTLHFATHGLVGGEARGLDEAALVLTPPQEARPDNDGLLTSSEIASLRLDADLVVLSACNTAAGDKLGADALSGLARSFFHAGARSLMVSHWPVQSIAAVKLTTRAMSEQRRTPGVGRAEALRRAMLALSTDASDPANAHPQVWAPFVIVGEGGSSVGSARPIGAAVPAAGVLKPGAKAQGETQRTGKEPASGRAVQPAKAAVPASPSIAPPRAGAAASEAEPAKAPAAPSKAAPQPKTPVASKSAAGKATTPALPAEGEGIPVPPGMKAPPVVQDAIVAPIKGTPVPPGTGQPQAKATAEPAPVQTQSIPGSARKPKSEGRSLNDVFGTN